MCNHLWNLSSHSLWKKVIDFNINAYRVGIPLRLFVSTFLPPYCMFNANVEGILSGGFLGQFLMLFICNRYVFTMICRNGRRPESFRALSRCRLIRILICYLFASELCFFFSVIHQKKVFGMVSHPFSIPISSPEDYSLNKNMSCMKNEHKTFFHTYLSSS